MNREENPMPGEKPGFTPQHEKKNGGFANTGERNPLPVEVKNEQGTQTIEGEVDVGNWPTSQVIEGSVKVDNIPDVQKVSGSVDVEFPESQEVRDTGVKERLDSMEEKFTELLDKTNELIGKTADRLDGTIDTRLTGSIDEYALPVKDDGLIEAIEKGGLVAFDQNLETGVGAIRIWTGTMDEYESIKGENIDDDIIYMIRG